MSSFIIIILQPFVQIFLQLIKGFVDFLAKRHLVKLIQDCLVETLADQAKGLGGTVSLDWDQGMLFPFPDKGSRTFWMKDMLLPIDIVWIKDDGTVLSVEGSIATSTYPTVFRPAEPIRYALEVRAGLAAERGWEAGTPLSLPIR